jgi:sporulation protein YlmC with PRC-barrel domain
MRLTDLLGARVLDVAGVHIGDVHDVRMTQDGLPIGGFGAALRVHSLVAGSPAVGVRLGFGRSNVRGPWVVESLFRRLHDDLRVIPWSLVAALGEGEIVLRVPDAELPRVPGERPHGSRVIDAGLELLDRQMVDREGRMAGNVDDLALAWRGVEGPPSVTAILAGPGALARRLGGRLGTAVAAIHGRLQDRDLEGPAQIDFGVVASIGSDVRLAVGRDALPTMRVERWVLDHLIGRIPHDGR